MRAHTALLAAALLAGCASAPPNTPGAGVGKSYTPVIDMHGVDSGRYLNDLDACRQYAGSINNNRAEWAGLIGGALLGAAIGASISSNLNVIGAGANSGALTGGASASGRALGTQQAIIGNCMASRGYRVLDGTARLSTTAQRGGPVVRAPIPAPNPPPTAPPTGKDAYMAEQLARQSQCSSDTMATLIAAGPGFEHYSMRCTNGDVMMIRCEWGNCRALK